MKIDMAAAVADRRRELKAFETSAEKAATLSDVNEDLNKDVDRLLKKQAALADLGAGHIESPLSTYDAKWHMTIEWAPMKSALTGRELATKLEPSIANLRQTIKVNEKEIERLLERS